MEILYTIVNVSYEQPRTNNNYLINDCENAYTNNLKKMTLIRMKG